MMKNGKFKGWNWDENSKLQKGKTEVKLHRNKGSIKCFCLMSQGFKVLKMPRQCGHPSVSAAETKIRGYLSPTVGPLYLRFHICGFNQQCSTVWLEKKKIWEWVDLHSSHLWCSRVNHIVILEIKEYLDMLVTQENKQKLNFQILR